MKTILDFHDKKIKKQKISMITCYDYTFARIVNSSDIDCILVGDSLGMVMHGKPNTIDVSTELIAIHTKAVATGAPDKFIVADMPFLANRKGLTANMNAVEKIMKAGAHALKIEGADGNVKLIRHLVDSGVPVQGHLGLTPQSIHQLGGFKVQGREETAKRKIMEQALALQDAGIFSLVLECVPSDLGKTITQRLEIPTIGIGAGTDTDGQVLVLQDMLGMNPAFQPKFVRKFIDGHSVILSALNDYNSEVKSQSFPNAKESYL